MVESIFLQDIKEKGTETFGTEEKFKNWLECPLSVLGGMTPQQWIDSKENAAEDIITLLNRIDHGIYS